MAEQPIGLNQMMQLISEGFSESLNGQDLDAGLRLRSNSLNDWPPDLRKSATVRTLARQLGDVVGADLQLQDAVPLNLRSSGSRFQFPGPLGRLTVVDVGYEWQSTDADDPFTTVELLSLTFGDVPSRPLTDSDIEVVSDDLPAERERGLRSWVEPLVGELSTAIDNGLIEDAMVMRRAERYRSMLHGELFETELGQLQVGIVVQVAKASIDILAPLSQAYDAQLAGRIANAIEGDSLDGGDYVRGRDILAQELERPKTEADMALTAFEKGVGLVAAIATLYGSFDAGYTPGVLFGAAVALIYFTVRAKVSGSPS